MPSPAPILQSLRDATHDLHQALDSQLSISRDDATLQDYADHLNALRPWLSGMRDALASTRVPELRDVALRIDRKLGAIDADLRDAVNMVGGGRLVAGAEAVVQPPVVRDLAYAWGMAYVVEGSQLGGAVMHRRLAPRLAPHPMRYFDAGTEGVGKAWRDFVHQLETHVSDAPAIESARRGAVEAFQRLMGRFGLTTPKAA